MDNSNFSKAIRERDISKVKNLLASGQCSPNGDGCQKFPPIIECIMGGSPDKDDTVSCELVELLVQYGADLNVRSENNGFCDVEYTGITPAMSAALRGNLRCLRFLVEAGADLDATSEEGDTAFTIAVKEANVECVKFLAHHLPVSALNELDDYNMTALMWAASAPGDKPLQCMQQLIAAGAQLDVEGDDGDTALMVAVRAGNDPGVKLLLESGALVNTVTNYGESPLTCAINGAHCSIAVKLLRHGADPTKSRRHLSCVQEMVSCGYSSVVRALVMHGFPPLDMAFVTCRYPDTSIKFRRKFKCYLETTRVSPLAAALLFNRPNMARYFIANQFFTRFDIVRLCWDPELRQFLQDGSSSETLEILDFLATRPQPLFNLCQVVVTSILTRDLACQPSNKDHTEAGPNPWVYSPTFREKVADLELPHVLRTSLLRQTPCSSICCQAWGDIPLGDVERSPACRCDYCEGIGASGRD
ncbi:hypothetical protein EGW08_004610 [Elysia chlorotica]|uniref:Uncharacterized protein n=1 Tax=Elysia chlorotica TaxID=188477 RepID=A0A3S1BSC3_ELYCH|nr:hypothetical protein EGW08_004610 [Elysia chlorotica]